MGPVVDYLLLVQESGPTSIIMYFDIHRCEGMRHMSHNQHSKSIIILALLMTVIIMPSPATTTVSADCEDDLAEVRAELNATKAELKDVEKERDDYAQRLEDSTLILIIVMFLMVGTYIVFYLNTRRAKIALLEYQKRSGNVPEPRPRRRRRG